MFDQLHVLLLRLHAAGEQERIERILNRVYENLGKGAYREATNRLRGAVQPSPLAKGA